MLLIVKLHDFDKKNTRNANALPYPVIMHKSGSCGPLFSELQSFSFFLPYLYVGIDFADEVLEDITRAEFIKGYAVIFVVFVVCVVAVL